MRPAIPSLFGLLLIFLGLAAAIPLSPGFPHPSDSPSTRQYLSSWRRLSDSIISKIWPAAEPQLPINRANKDTTGTKPGKLVASYSEDVVLRFNVSTAEEAQSLSDAAYTLFLDVWDFTQDWVDIRTQKHVIPSLLRILPESLQTKHVALLDNLDLMEAVFDTFPSYATGLHSTDHSTSPLRPLSPSDNVFFQNYQPYSVIVPWMNLLASMFPSHVRRINVGISYEGRDIPGLRVGVHPANDDQPSEKRKTILITGGLHAREWISVSTVNYVAWSLITSYGKNAASTNLIEAFDWVFIPTLNPDGYVYSWETDRLWRKNRQPTSVHFCPGLDLDRSFSFHWDGETSIGNPCSESYSGSAPFQGVESQRFADWAKNETENNNAEFVTFLDLHSYSQQVLYPFSYTCQSDPPTIEDLQELAFGLSKAIRLSQNGHFYHAIPACEGNVAMKDGSKADKKYFPRIESGGGSALDYFYHELKVKFAYQIKLRDTGTYGFLLPKENIVPTGQEMLDAALYLGRYLLGEVGLQAGSRTEEEEELTRLRNHRAAQSTSDLRSPKVGDNPDDWDWDDEDDSEIWELRRR